MFAHKKIKDLNDFFIEMDGRPEQCVYFYRIDGYTEEVGRFIREYYEAARAGGVVIEGRIPNPDEKNLAYFDEIMGRDFRMSQAFLEEGLRKWMPRMKDDQRGNVAAAVHDALDALRSSGRNENMLKNAYIKFMCWLYYKFERVANLLGGERVPKILYEGDIGNYELLLISALSSAGCDAVLLQYHGDAGYLKADPDSSRSDRLVLPGMSGFPPGFGLKWIRAQMQEAAGNERLYGTRPHSLNCTNAWIEGKGLSDFRKNTAARGSGPGFFYNCYYRINGVEDKTVYVKELYQFWLELKNSGRRVAVVDGCLPVPSPEEITAVRRRNYARQDEMLMEMSSNIQYSSNIELQRLMVKSFLDVMLAAAKLPGMNLNRMTNKAVCLVCWIRRYTKELFSNWKLPEIGCFIHMGPCKSENETLFMQFLARIPVDVLILNPDLDTKCGLEDTLLYEISFAESLPLMKYPQQNADVQMGTAAYHAERELDSLMYQDTGLYRSRQYAKADSITLQTMYEEIPILWREEPKYRPNFSTENDVVLLPVIFAKISGVKDGNIAKYWSLARELVTDDTVVVRNVPFIDPAAPNPMKAFSTEFFKNGRIWKKGIREHREYRYGHLRDEIQEHILDKLQLLIDRKLIRGTFENGMEYTIAATVLNMPREIVRLIQKFDFTRRNPKLIYFNTGERMISPEDSILTAFLNLAGFDVLFFVPTGYQNIERHFNRRLMEEHQAGEYLYDLQTPNMAAVSPGTRPSWRDRIFGRDT